MPSRLETIMQDWPKTILADEIGYTSNAIMYWYRGSNRMSVHAAALMAAVADVPVADIVYAHIADYNDEHGIKD